MRNEDNRFGKRLKMRRSDLGLTLQDVADAVGSTTSTIKRWEDGEVSAMKHTKVKALATALHTTPEYLMGWEDDPSMYSGAEPIEHLSAIPLQLQHSGADNAYQLQLPERFICDFAVRIDDNDMAGSRLMEGDLVLVDQSTAPFADGELVAVLADTKTIVRRYVQGMLIADNSSQVYREDDIDVRILGRAKYVIGELR